MRQAAASVKNILPKSTLVDLTLGLYALGCCCWFAAPRSQANEYEKTYPRDVTVETLADPDALASLQRPGHIFFEEDFESPDTFQRWYGRIGESEGRTQRIDSATLAHTGTGVLELKTEDRAGQASAAGASYWFHPGYDTVYFRRYLRFAEDYDQGNLNHVGGSLYAVVGDDRWAEMGKAGIRPQEDDRFGAAFEPWRAWNRNSPPGAMMLYAYWMDMKRNRSGKNWGNMFTPPKPQQVLLSRGQWHCLEHMLRAGAPGQADGEMAAWVDGQLYIHLKGFLWRTSGEVRLKRISLGLYVHQSRRENNVWYDDVALSTGYIGIVRTISPGTGSTPNLSGR